MRPDTFDPNAIARTTHSMQRAEGLITGECLHQGLFTQWDVNFQHGYWNTRLPSTRGSRLSLQETSEQTQGSRCFPTTGIHQDFPPQLRGGAPGLGHCSNSMADRALEMQSVSGFSINVLSRERGCFQSTYLIVTNSKVSPAEIEQQSLERRQSTVV